MAEDSSEAASSPLGDLVVIEAASFLSGPMAGMILGDLGADVIKVEPPRGDPYRRMGTAYGDSSLLFKATNQTKRSVVLDLKTDQGVQALFGLLEDADVLLTNWRPGVAERMGLDTATVRERFPRLVWARVSGYGQTGPRSTLPAYDGIIQARSGSSVSGGGDPMNTNNSVADKVSAMFAANTITAALYQRSRTGQGSVVDLAMVDALAYFYGADISAGHRLVDAEPDLRVGRQILNDSTFETADGWINLAPVTGRQLRRAMQAAGIGDRFNDVMEADRSTTFAVFCELMKPVLVERSAIEWEERFIEADVPAAAVRDFTGHIDDVQTQHNRTYEPVPDPSIDRDWLTVRFPGLFNGHPVDRQARPAPELESPAHPNDD